MINNDTILMHIMLYLVYLLLQTANDDSEMKIIIYKYENDVWMQIANKHHVACIPCEGDSNHCTW